MTFFNLKRVSLRNRRTLVVVASIMLVVLAIVGYGLWSMNVWSTYKVTYEGWQKELRTSIDAAAILPVATSSERTKKMTAFKDISNNINNAKQSLCRTPVLVTWQHSIDNLRQREEACTRIVSGAEAFGKKMQAMTTYLEKEQALAAAMARAFAASEGKVTESTWEPQIATWQNAIKDIEKISAPEAPFNKLKATAIEKIQSVEGAWRELIAAHTAKDKTKYLEAQTKLSTAYETLLSLPTASGGQLEVLAASLQTTYSQVFGPTT